MQLIDHRLRTTPPSQEHQDLATRFARDHQLCKEVELGLRIMAWDKAYRFMGSRGASSQIRRASDPNEGALREMQLADPEVEGIVRALRSGVSRGEQRGGESRSGHKHSRGSEERHRRSRSRRHHRHHEPSGGSGSQARLRSADRPPAAEEGHKSSRRTESRREAPPPAPPPRGGGARKGGGDKFEAWLTGLDGGRGALQRYLPSLQREFPELADLKQALMPKPQGTSVVGRIDPSLWEALGVEALGHRLLLAKGIVALASK